MIILKKTGNTFHRTEKQNLKKCKDEYQKKCKDE